MSMRTRAALLAAALALGLPGLAMAVKPGEPLYVKAKNTRVMESPSPTANAVAILQPGAQVKWEGADPKQKQWHRVTAPDGKKGFVFQANLSTQPPNMELVSKDGDKRKVDPAGFVATGAAVKALSPGAVDYGKKQGESHQKAVTQIQALEDLARKVSPEDIARHVAEAGLHPVVGPSDTVAAAAPAKAPAAPAKKKKGGS